MSRSTKRPAILPALLILIAIVLASGLGAVPAAGKGGRPTTTGSTTSTSTTSSTLPPTTTTTTRGGSETGTLFGDLYALLRYQGLPDEPDGTVGGQPLLSDGYGWYVFTNEDGSFEVRQATALSECLQPVADDRRWGDIWKDGSPAGPTDYERGLDRNRLPLIMTYDATHDTTDAEIGLLTAEPTANADGTLNFQIDPYFVEPGDTWEDPVNGVVTYPEGVLWTDLVQAVDFGRMNIGRSPEAVLQAHFDEAISTINSPDTVDIKLDAAGRLLLTKNVYDELRVDPDTGEPLLIGTVEKAIDSPLENLALYVKLMKDGHLVTPGDEREPIDKSLKGGIPLWKLIELEDGPSTALRPTIDIQKMRDHGLGELVDVSEEPYYAYYSTDPVSDLVPEYKVVPAEPVPTDLPDGTLVSIGLMTDDGGSPAGRDFEFAAAFFAAAADKTSDIGVDMVVYLNSILGINQVVGTSADGTIDYSLDPVYFDFAGATGYDRPATMAQRGDGGSVQVLQEVAEEAGMWRQVGYPVAEIGYDDIGRDANYFLNNTTAASDIFGFTQMADDDLSVIEFIHTYQIPELR